MIDSMEPAPVAEVVRRGPRGSLLVGAPGLAVLLLCLFLPGYDDCGHVRQVADTDGGLLLPCIAGLIAGVVTLTRTSRRSATPLGFGMAGLIVCTAWLGLIAMVCELTLIGLALELCAMFWVTVAIGMRIRERERLRRAGALGPTLCAISLVSYAYLAIHTPSEPPPKPPSHSDSSSSSPWLSADEWIQALHSAAHGG